MMCDRYWREGIVLVERGLNDPHRDGCADCTRAHASRQELVEALPLIAAGYCGDAQWQAKVWRRIDGARAHAPRRWRWQLAGAFAMVCVVALWIGLGRTRSPSSEARPSLEIISDGEPMRSASARDGDRVARAGDRVRVVVGESSDVWIYCDQRLELHCRAGQASPGCAPGADGMVVEMLLRVARPYHVLVTRVSAPQPPHKLDDGRATLEEAGTLDTEYTVKVR